MQLHTKGSRKQQLQLERAHQILRDNQSLFKKMQDISFHGTGNMPRLACTKMAKSQDMFKHKARQDNQHLLNKLQSIKSHYSIDLMLAAQKARGEIVQRITRYPHVPNSYTRTPRVQPRALPAEDPPESPSTLARVMQSQQNFKSSLHLSSQSASLPI